MNLPPKKMLPGRLPMPRQGMLIEHRVNGSVVAQRPIDGYINATALCKKVNKLFADYRRLATTKEFLDALAADIEIPISELIQTNQGGNEPKLQGTMVHPQVATHLGQWLSPQFAVQVSKWVIDWMKGKSTGWMPSHVKRYMANRAQIPSTHFSMLNEIYLHLIAPLEDADYILPDRMMPDISTGRMFSGFLRSKGIEPNDFPSYAHAFSDGRVVQARLYPNEHLAVFRKYFHEQWLPKQALSYFKTRVPDVVPMIKEIVAALPAPPSRKKIKG